MVIQLNPSRIFERTLRSVIVKIFSKKYQKLAILGQEEFTIGLTLWAPLRVLTQRENVPEIFNAVGLARKKKFIENEAKNKQSGSKKF